MKGLPALPVVIGLSLLLASCGKSAGPPDAISTKTTTTTTTTTTTAAPLPVTPITWTACNGDLQCGTLIVPLDYAHPRGATIGIAVERHLARDVAGRIGSLVINPGGPGVSGIDDFANELDTLTPQLLDDFDIVTFDPRGVERSDPVTCGETPGAARGPLPDPVPQNPAAQKSIIANMRQFGDDCEKASGAILPYVGTVDVARDLDRLRQALGDSGLTYMGQSYGTLIGATYAQLFPSEIRAMVLDSAIDPALSLSQLTLGQAEGFEGVLNSFFGWCAGTTSCLWRPAGDPTTALLGLLAQSRTSPAPAGNGRTAGPGELYNALLAGLYAASDWPQLGNALATDAAGNGADVVAMSDHYAMDGSTNGSDAGEAIDCLDHPAVQSLGGLQPIGDTLRAVGARLRATPGLGRGGVRRMAGQGHPYTGSRNRTGISTDSGDRHHARPGHALRLVRESGRRVEQGRPPDSGGERPRVLLLQRVRASRRADVSDQPGYSTGGSHLQRLMLRGWFEAPLTRHSGRSNAQRKRRGWWHHAKKA